ncbi:hypothetical protein EVAR_93037_1 [Eumeta japonica]|uniref:Uncharacterized protein n=1 Tax=Eumeta variegata TaxID=151549 RepID=A0A4C1TEW6_EUMVA|nr:hypothetical protein EVAR_93037_1 [Eumeta japonica]
MADRCYPLHMSAVTRGAFRGGCEAPAVLPRGYPWPDVGYGLSGVTGRKPTIISNPHVAACDRSAAGRARPTPRDGLGRRIFIVLRVVLLFSLKTVPHFYWATEPHKICYERFVSSARNFIA